MSFENLLDFINHDNLMLWEGPEIGILKFEIGQHNNSLEAYTAYGYPLHLFNKSLMIRNTWNNQISNIESLHLLPSINIKTHELEFKIIWIYLNGLLTNEIKTLFYQYIQKFNFDNFLYICDWFSIDLNTKIYKTIKIKQILNIDVDVKKVETAKDMKSLLTYIIEYLVSNNPKYGTNTFLYINKRDSSDLSDYEFFFEHFNLVIKAQDLEEAQILGHLINIIIDESSSQYMIDNALSFSEIYDYHNPPSTLKLSEIIESLTDFSDIKEFQNSPEQRGSNYRFDDLSTDFGLADEIKNKWNFIINKLIDLNFEFPTLTLKSVTSYLSKNLNEVVNKSYIK